MGARLINNNGQIITKLKSGQDDVKIKYEQINGKFEPVYYDGYVLYNSLKSDGNAYIDLGHKGDSTHRYELDFEWQMLESEITLILGFFGARASYRSKEISIIKGASPQIAAVMQNGSGNGIRKIFTIDLLPHRYKINIARDTIVINIDGIPSTSANTVTTDFVTDTNLLAYRMGGGITNTSTTTFHSIKEYDQNNQLIYHYVPARRQSDNALGMLDVINGVFYGNANSVGTFEIN